MIKELTCDRYGTHLENIDDVNETLLYFGISEENIISIQLRDSLGNKKYIIWYKNDY